MGKGETIRLQPNVNVVQRTRIPEQEEESSGPSVITLGNSDKDNNKSDKKDKNGDVEIGNPYDPDNIQKLIKDAQNVGKLMDQHGKEIEQATRQQQ